MFGVFGQANSRSTQGIKMVKIIASNTCWVLCFEILGRKKLMTSGRGDHWGVVELKTEGRLKLKEDW